MVKTQSGNSEWHPAPESAQHPAALGPPHARASVLSTVQAESPALCGRQFQLPGHGPLRELAADLRRLLTRRTDHHAFLDHVDDVVGVHGIEEKDLARL